MDFNYPICRLLFSILGAKMQPKVALYIILVALLQDAGAWLPTKPAPPVLTRMQCMRTATSAATKFAIALLLALHPGAPDGPLGPPPSWAFDNAVPNNFKAPKSAGPKPSNLGIDANTGKLRMCLKPSPNCFSTTPDTFSADPDSDTPSMWGDGDIHAIARWQYPKAYTPDEAYQIIGDVLSSYPPGQQDIDGGGFKVVTADGVRRYYYAQFESLRRGYIDDVEIKVDDDAGVQVVSSSRLGYLDFRVNAVRLNYLAGQLRKKGFVAAEITPATHAIYFDSNPGAVKRAPIGDATTAAATPSGGLGLGKKKY